MNRKPRLSAPVVLASVVGCGSAVVVGGGVLAGAATLQQQSPVVYEGKVGGAPIVMVVDPTTWTGAYFYRSNGQDIPLKGTPDRLLEFNPDRPRETAESKAIFTGKLSSDKSKYSGTWSASSFKKPSDFVLTRSPKLPTASETKATVTTSTKTVKSAKTAGLFDVKYSLPIVSGLTPDWVNFRITQNLRATALFGDTVEQALGVVKQGGGTVLTTFVTTYNKHSLLSVNTHTETEQAYPDQFDSYSVFDLNSGNRLGFSDLFPQSARSNLTKVLQRKLDVNIAAAEKQQPGQGITRNLHSTGADKITAATLDSFSLTKSGLEFHYDYGLPHAMKALEPDGLLSMSWTELEPLLSPRLLAELKS